ncbi:MAG: helix-hairpin-helix domain-containing protein [Myxococcota bacterium]
MRLPTDRTIPLLAISFCLAGGGILWRLPTSGSEPVICPSPATISNLQLTCDGEGQPAGARGLLVGHPLNVNTASARDLAHMPHVSKTLAKRLVKHREQHGHFHHFHQLQAVKGIGQATLKKLAPFLAVRPL